MASALPPRCTLERNSWPCADAADGGDDAVADDEGADVLALALRDEFLEQDLLLGAVERLDDGFGDLDLVGEDDADALGAFEQLDDDRRAADAHQGVLDVALVIDVGGEWDADIVAGKNLQASAACRGNCRCRRRCSG